MKNSRQHLNILFLSIFIFTFISIQSISANSIFHEKLFLLDTIPDSEVEEEIFMIVEEAPRFPGCEHLDISKFKKETCAERKMLEYIYGNLSYPEDARKKFIEGQVIIQFVVDKDGSVDDIVLVQDIGGGCGEESLKVIQNMNNLPKKWRPGKQRGRAVRVKYTIPIKFKLTD